MRRKPVCQKPTAVPTGAPGPAGIVVPTVLSAAVTGGAMLALALAGSLVVEGTAGTFDGAAPTLHHPGTIAAIPGPPIVLAPAPSPPPAVPPRNTLPRRPAATVVAKPVLGVASHPADERRTPTRVVHRPRKNGRSMPASSGGTGPGSGGGSAPDISDGPGDGTGGGTGPGSGGGSAPDISDGPGDGTGSGTSGGGDGHEGHHHGKGNHHGGDGHEGHHHGKGNHHGGDGHEGHHHGKGHHCDGHDAHDEQG
jgi:hypothetical protein